MNKYRVLSISGKKVKVLSLKSNKVWMTLFESEIKFEAGDIITFFPFSGSPTPEAYLIIVKEYNKIILL